MNFGENCVLRGARNAEFMFVGSVDENIHYNACVQIILA